MRYITSRSTMVGMATGMFSGLTGVGGGALVVSLMVSWLGMSQALAQGTAPAVIIPVALFGAATYLVQGLSGQFVFDSSLALQLVPALAIPSMFGVVIGGTWLVALPVSQLRRAFGVFLFFVSLTMLTRGILPIGTPPGEMISVPLIFWIMLGFVSGVFSGVLGIGGAMVMIPFMTIGAGIPQHMTQGITLAVVTITTVMGAYTQYKLGNVDGKATRQITPSATITVIAAGLIAGYLDAFWLTKLCGVVLAYFAAQFTFSKRTNRPTTPTSSRSGADPSAGFYNI